jgi:hypothetical protein
VAPYPFSTRKNALLAVPTGKLLILSSVTYGLLCFSQIDYNMLWSDLGKQILSPEGSQGRIKEKRMRPDEHLAAVLAAEAAGQEADFLFFWGHQPRPDGTTGPGCLSQWWPAPFSIDDITYPTAEHWMMAAKARLWGVGMGARNPDVKRPSRWRGTNLLGFALMNARNQL